MPEIPQLRKMFPHQRRGLTWAESRDRIALFWEMRLGKTLLAIRWAKHRQAFPALVVCPSDILETWQEELHRERQNYSVCLGYESEPLGVGWHLTSYDTLRRNQHLQRFPWETVLLDESTAIKNPKAMITKVCLSSFENVPNRAILTGTPAPESHLEYFTQMQFLTGELCGFGNFWNFRANMFRSGFNGWKWHPLAGTINRIASEVGRVANTLTRRQAGLDNREVKEVRRLEMPTSLKSVYRHAEEQFVLGDDKTMWASVAYTWLVRLAGGCHPSAENDYKVKPLIDLMRTDFRKEQVVVWCSFNAEIDRVSQALAKSKISHGIIRGDVKNSDRTAVNGSFQRGKLQVLICQPKCAQFGRDFSAASTSIYFSLPWDLKSYLQSRSRIAHPSKKDTLLTIHLVGRDSVDEDIYKALMVKHDTEMSFRMLLRQGFLDRIGKP